MDRLKHNFRYIILQEDMQFDLTYICPSCAYWLAHYKEMYLDKIVDTVNDLVLNLECSVCPQGCFNYIYAMLYSLRCNLRMNASCLRIMRDERYLQEAYENPSSLNVCSCNKYDAYLAVTIDNKIPFICGYCTKLFVDSSVQSHLRGLKEEKTPKIRFNSLRNIQIHIFRDYFPVYYDFNDSTWKEPENDHSRYRPKENNIILNKKL